MSCAAAGLQFSLSRKRPSAARQPAATDSSAELVGAVQAANSATASSAAAAQPPPGAQSSLQPRTVSSEQGSQQDADKAAAVRESESILQSMSPEEVGMQLAYLPRLWKMDAVVSCATRIGLSGED